MKKMKYIILCLCAAMGLTFTSCDDFLDITPDGQVKRDELLSTEEGIQDALYGVYAQLRQGSLYGQELSFSALEVMAQTLYCSNKVESRAKTITALGNYEYTYSGVETLFENVWVEMYENIRNANSVLNSPLIENATEYPFTIYRGEALALRAFMHFDLVRLYAEQYTVNPEADGIPYATEFSLNTPDFESLAKNYEHILADLSEAELLLEDEDYYEGTSNFMLDRQIHLNKYAVKALLARVYLTMGNKEKALEYAVEVIDSRQCVLKEKTEVANDLAGILSAKETLWGVYYADFYSRVKEYLHDAKPSSFYISDDFVSLYDKDAAGIDFRVSAYFNTIDLGGISTVRLIKLTDIYELNNIAGERPSNLILGVNMIRLPEMYYIAAECLLDTDYNRAVEYYEEVRAHRGLDPLADSNNNAGVEEDEDEGQSGVVTDSKLTIERINEERYKEYIGEGQAFFNMKRQNLPILSANGETTYEASKAIYVVPIPDIEKENRN